MLPLFLTGLSKVINTYLQLDPDSAKRLSALNGKIISVELLPLHFNFYCKFVDGHLQVSLNETTPADAQISGTPWQMLNVMINKEERHRFFTDDIKMTGNVELANQVVKLFDELHVDLENELARFLGDTAAVKINHFVKNTKDWLNTTFKAFSADINEYTHEELNWFPTAEALKNFHASIDELRMDTDRIASKIQALHMKISSGQANTQDKDNR
jgi:ubiquinone biosynthesis protein UbiJ